MKYKWIMLCSIRGTNTTARVANKHGCYEVLYNIRLPPLFCRRSMTSRKYKRRTPREHRVIITTWHGFESHGDTIS